MALNPQSEALISQLLAGGTIISGDVICGLLNADSIALLKLISKKLAELTSKPGSQQAILLRDEFVIALNEQSTTASPTASAQPATGPIPPIVGRGWRLDKLTLISVRGAAPAGAQVIFDFEQRSNLIYGPNGSGKSSLLAAPIWLMTGRTITDAGSDEEIAPAFKSGDGTSRGTKLVDWPAVATLPGDGDIKSTTPSADVSAELVANDGTRLFLRRKLLGDLEASQDNVTWQKVLNFGQFGISPLDLQLSLLAPAILCRRELESTNTAHELLGLCLG